MHDGKPNSKGPKILALMKDVPTVTPINDTLVEPTETAIFTIKPDPSYDVGNANTTTLYITDSDQPPANTLRRRSKACSGSLKRS